MMEEQYLNRIEDLEKEVAILKQYRVEKDLLMHIVKLRERVAELERARPYMNYIDLKEATQ